VAGRSARKRVTKAAVNDGAVGAEGSREF